LTYDPDAQLGSRGCQDSLHVHTKFNQAKCSVVNYRVYKEQEAQQSLKKADCTPVTEGQQM